MNVMAGNSPEGKLRLKPFPERGSWGHLGPVELGLAAGKNIQVRLGDKGLQFNDLGVVKGGDWETINVTETQMYMAISFGSGKGVTEGGIWQEKRWGKNNT